MSNFEDQQKNYYLNQINRALPATSRVADQSTIQAALGIVDMNGATPTAATEFIDTFGRDSDIQQRDAACRITPYPGLAMRSSDARTGCGWWYVADPATPSSGAFGTRRGPMNPHLDREVGAGRWIWDPQEAQEYELLKQARSVQTCADIGYSKYGSMGWCASTGRAIPLDNTGAPLYPRAPGGDCAPDQIITTPSMCSTATATTTGSVSQPAGISGTCTPAANGTVSPACLQMAVQQSCPATGVLSQSLGGSAYAGSSTAFNNAYAYYSQNGGFSLPAGLIAGGATSFDEVASGAAMLKSAMTRSDVPMAVRAAAANLCTGAAFDPCSFVQGTDRPPFQRACITQAALAAGWSPQGSLLQDSAFDSFWNKLGSWQDVLNTIAATKQNADQTGRVSAADQATAIQQVYGISVKYPKQGCNNNGVYLYRYFFPTWDQKLFAPGGPNTHFLGRMMFRDGFPNKPSTTEDMTPAGGNLTEGQRYITVFQPTQSGTYQFLIGHDDGVRMLIDDEVFMDWQPCCGNAVSPFRDLVAGQTYKFTIDLWNGGGAWAFFIQMSINGSAWQPVPAAQLTLPYDRRLPTFELAFNKMPAGTGNGPIRDTNSVFQNLLMWQNCTVGSLNGRQCMLVNGTGSGVYSFNTYNQGVRGRAFKSLTAMVQVDSMLRGSGGAGSSPSLISFHNLSGSSPTTYPRMGPPPESWDYTTRVQDLSVWVRNGQIQLQYTDKRNPEILQQYYFNNRPFPFRRWNHLAIVWDEDFNGHAIYINGNLSGQLRATGPDVAIMFEQMRIGCDATDDGAVWYGGIAWFRGFDYRLSSEQIQMDMNDAWDTLQ
jgi:hypothetical protein